MIDLTTKLNNYALTCDSKAKTAREEAVRIGQTPRTNFDEYNQSHIDRPVKEAQAEAKAWEARAAEARRGFLLVDPGDVAFIMTNHLVDEAAAQSRVTYSGGVADPAHKPHPADDTSWQRA